MNFARPDLEEFFRSYSITTFAVSNDESTLAFATNLSGKYNIWGMDVKTGYPYPISHCDQLPHAIRFDPNGRYIIAGFDHDGDENVQLYLLPPSGGARQELRMAPQRRHYLTGLSKDGNRVYYCSDKDNHSFMNGYCYDIDTGEETVLLVGENAATFLVDVAPDESSFLFIRAFANTYMVPYVQEGDTVRCLTPNPDVPHGTRDVAYAGGDRILVTTDFEADRAYLAAYNLQTAEFQKLWAPEAADVGDIRYHEASHTAYLLVHQGVEDRMYHYHLDTDTVTAVVLPCPVVQEFRVTEAGNLYILGRSDVEPLNLFCKQNGGEWRRLTDNRVMGIAKEDLVTPEVVTFPSFDGLDIEALWFPAKAQTATGYTVIWPHGGPQAAERRAFRAFFQFLCSRGYNIWAPNFRGSTGYGSHFAKLVEGDWGDGPRLDMVESMEWLIREGKAERDKLFLVGGSYGGYMTLLLHGRHAEYFQACVDIFGPSNLLTFVESVPDSWKPMMRQWLGDAEVDKDRLLKDSPITYLDGMTKPMLVIQGANDPRVVKAESDQIVASLQARGVEVEYLVFDDEGHGFMKKENEINAYRTAVEFLDRHRS